MFAKVKYVCAIFALLVVSACADSNVNSDEEVDQDTEEVTQATTVSESGAYDYILYGIDWSDDKGGVLTTIDHARIEEQEDSLSGEKYNALFVHFKIQNNSDKPYDIYPDQGKLVIGNTQIDSNMYASDRLGGQLLNGAVKEGYVVFDLPNSIDVNSLSEIRLAWSHLFDILEDNNYDVNLKLNKKSPDLRG